MISQQCVAIPDAHTLTFPAIICAWLYFAGQGEGEHRYVSIAHHKNVESLLRTVQSDISAFCEMGVLAAPWQSVSIPPWVLEMVPSSVASRLDMRDSYMHYTARINIPGG